MRNNIPNFLTLEVNRKLGHGGYLRAWESDFDPAKLWCGVPWKHAEIKFWTPKFWHGQKLSVVINIGRYTAGKIVEYDHHFETYFKMADPTFDPQKLADDLVKIIEILKSGYKDQQRTGKKRFLNYCVKRAWALWPKVGRTEDAREQ